jgi:hypothetical protein
MLQILHLLSETQLKFSALSWKQSSAKIKTFADY